MSPSSLGAIWRVFLRMHRFRDDLASLRTGDMVVTLERQLRRPDDRACLLLIHCVRIAVFDSGLGNPTEV